MRYSTVLCCVRDLYKPQLCCAVNSAGSALHSSSNMSPSATVLCIQVLKDKVRSFEVRIPYDAAVYELKVALLCILQAGRLQLERDAAVSFTCCLT